MARKERLSDISPFKNVIAVASIGLVMSACEPQERQPVVVTPEAPPSPTREISSPTPEVIPSPTPRIELVGFGGLEELTSLEQEAADSLLQDYTQAARRQNLDGTIFLTLGDQEGEVGAYFSDLDETIWFLVKRDGREVLEEVPDFQEVAPSWNPNELRFEYQGLNFDFTYNPQEELLYVGSNVVGWWEHAAWWTPSWSDDFSQQRDFELWPTDGVNFYVRDGVYHLNPETSGEVWSGIHPEKGDWLLELDMKIENGDAVIMIGNPRERSFYAFQFHDWGGFQVDQVERDTWQDINDPEAIDGVSAGRTFAVKIVRQEGQIILFVNGEEIYDRLPDRLKAVPEVGFMVGGGDRVKVDNVKFWDKHPWATPIRPEPTAIPEPQPIPEPAAEICGVETGICYPRTQARDGDERPNGIFYLRTFDPDPIMQGSWFLYGRVAEIVDWQQGIFLFNIGKGGETLLIRVRWLGGEPPPEGALFGPYARLVPLDRHGKPCPGEACPEVGPVLGRDIQVGDFLEIDPSYGLPPDFRPLNNLTEDENYQRLLRAHQQGTQFNAYIMELIQ